MHFINVQNRKIFNSFVYVLFNFNVVIFEILRTRFFLIVSLFKKKVHRMIAKNLPRKGS